MNFAHAFEPVPARDWWVILSLFVGIIAFIAISEAVRHKLRWSEEFTRKLVHISVGLLMFFAPILLQTSMPMIVIALFFTAFNFIALKKGLLKGMHGQRQSYGTVYYPLSFLILVLLAWPENKIIIIAAMMVLALGDALAAIWGQTAKHPRKFVLISEQKSFQGSIVMLLVSILVVFLLLRFYPFNGYYPENAWWVSLWMAVITGLMATVAEAMSSKGSDNLTVPLITAIFLYFMIHHSLEANLRLTLGLFLAVGVSFISYKLKFLSDNGAFATFLLATIIFGFGGWAWAVPILTFFVLSSVLSKWGKSVKSEMDKVFEKGSRRDYLQVLANGGLAGALMILFMFYENPLIYLFYLGALAAATADTWATEIGVLARQTPRLIHNWRTVPSGTSGAVTPAGLLGALAGALVLALSGKIFLGTQVAAWPFSILFLITASGFLASIVDSFLGATVQVQYRCPVCGKQTEKMIHCNKTKTEPVSGISGINNDAVNFITTLSAIVFVQIGILFIT